MDPALTVALITAVPVLIAQYVSWYSANRKLHEIHLVVNSRLDAALLKITATETEVRTLRKALTDMASTRVNVLVPALSPSP